MKLTETRLESLATTEGYPREALWLVGPKPVVDFDVVTELVGQA